MNWHNQNADDLPTNLTHPTPSLLTAQNAVTPGQFITEPPTLQNLGFEWYINGDDNRNATVKVEYRLAGSGSEWKKGCPC